LSAKGTLTDGAWEIVSERRIDGRQLGSGVLTVSAKFVTAAITASWL
jgi:hypothetical protein